MSRIGHVNGAEANSSLILTLVFANTSAESACVGIYMGIPENAVHKSKVAVLKALGA